MQILNRLIILLGLAMWFWGSSLPVYTDRDAPGRLSRELEKLPREERFKAWYQQLATFETPHKQRTDLARGVVALGIGLWLARRLWRPTQAKPDAWRSGAFFAAWLLLWAVHLPCTFWYYAVRANRFDYPVWGDSIGIPVVEETIAWGICGLLSLFCVRLLLRGRNFSAKVRLQRPSGPWVWLRMIAAVGWLCYLPYATVLGIMDGDEGMVITTTAAVPLLFAVLMAEPCVSIKDPVSTEQA